jgi:hypothetical protein
MAFNAATRPAAICNKENQAQAPRFCCQNHAMESTDPGMGLLVCNQELETKTPDAVNMKQPTAFALCMLQRCQQDCATLPLPLLYCPLPNLPVPNHAAACVGARSRYAQLVVQ